MRKNGESPEAEGFGDFLVSAGGQAVVGLMPNGLRRRFYEKFLRKDGEADGE